MPLYSIIRRRRPRARRQRSRKTTRSARNAEEIADLLSGAPSPHWPKRDVLNSHNVPPPLPMAASIGLVAGSPSALSMPIPPRLFQHAHQAAQQLLMRKVNITECSQTLTPSLESIHLRLSISLHTGSIMTDHPRDDDDEAGDHPQRAHTPVGPWPPDLNASPATTTWNVPPERT